MAPIINLEPRVLTPIEIGLNFAWMTRDGGAGLNGVTQIASPLTGLWEVSLVFEQVTNARARYYRALKMQAKGRYCWIRVPIFDPFIINREDIGIPPGTLPLHWDEGVLWSDGSGWALSDIRTTTSGVTNLGAEEINLAITGNLDSILGLGHYFSINDYLYMITSVGDLVSSKVRTYGIGPPLRETVAANSVVMVGRPTILCRLADDRSGSIRLRLGKYGQPTMDFIEVIDRAEEPILEL